MTAKATFRRRLPVGAEVTQGGSVHLRVWAPGHRSVAVAVAEATAGSAAGAGGSSEVALDPEADGYWSGFVPGLRPGGRYRIRVDGGRPVPDPASRFQPEGPHGPSEMVDPSAFTWTDADWQGPDPMRDAIYELHVGTYTPQGTYAAAAAHLDELARLGIGIVELLPLAEFPGRFGWGYDGVDLFAPMHVYGTPDDLRRFVDKAHSAGIAVILDVVYNHFGPDGCYLTTFSDTWFSRRHTSEWGETPNFDEPGSDGVRDFVLANARAWIEEYHLDGLRLDATQQVFDGSPDHIVAAITRTVREAAGGRRTVVVAENEPQEARMIRPVADGGFGLDALWNDDIHHAARVALTGQREAYYTNYRGAPQEFVSAAKHGFLYQGQRYAWQKARRGTPALDLPPSAFVAYLENHDQVANSARGERTAAIADPGRLRALTAYILLGPARPMLFMGQEWAASAPFTFFADHAGKLAAAVDRGRRKFLRQFPSIAIPEVLAAVPSPADVAAFEKCRLDHAERTGPEHAPWLALHRDLLALRHAWLAGAKERTDGLDTLDPTDALEAKPPSDPPPAPDSTNRPDASPPSDGPEIARATPQPDRADARGPAHGLDASRPSDGPEIARATPRPDRGPLPPGLDGAVLGAAAFCLRFFAQGATPERLLVVNLGPTLDLGPAPEPLLAPPDGARWHMRLTTDDPRYGGKGGGSPETRTGWVLPAESAVVFEAKPRH